MPQDPLSISEGINTGEAQVLDNRAYDMFSQYAKQKQNELTAKRKSATDAIKGIEDIRLAGFAGHQKDLLDKKNQVYDKLRQGFRKNGFDWTPSADVDTTKSVNELKDKVVFSQAIEKQFAADHNDMVSKKDSWTPESMHEVTDFYSMPLDKQYEYVNAHNSFPVLKPKEKVVDYTSFIQKTETPYNTVQAEIGKDADGRIQYRTTKELDVNAAKSQATDAYDAAVNGRSDEYNSMLKDINKDIDTNPNTSHLSPEKKNAIAQQNFVNKFVKIKEGVVSTKHEQGSKSSGNGLGSGTTKLSKNVSVVRNNYDGQDNIQFQYSNIQDNTPLKFTKQNGEVVEGVPKLYKRDKNGTYELHIDVPKVDYEGNAIKGQFDDVVVDYKTGADVIFNEYGFNPFTVIEGNTPKNVKVTNVGGKKESDSVPTINSKSEFDALPKGAKYKKIDGKTYTKG